MSEAKLLTIRDAAQILGISEKEVVDLAEQGKIPAYKVGGVYLRFKPEQIEEFRKSSVFSLRHTQESGRETSTTPLNEKIGFKNRISDFFYFNDFYILSILLILLMLMLIFGGY